MAQGNAICFNELMGIQKKIIIIEQDFWGGGNPTAQTYPALSSMCRSVLGWGSCLVLVLGFRFLSLLLFPFSSLFSFSPPSLPLSLSPLLILVFALVLLLFPFLLPLLFLHLLLLYLSYSLVKELVELFARRLLDDPFKF